MMPVFGNPLGGWALLAVPAIVAIHFLQQRAKVATTSTWFLIEKLAPDSARGRTWEQLRSSRTLWLQLLAALLAAWVLVEPRWVQADSTQTVVVVLDASASMQPFADRAVAAGETELNSAQGFAAHTTWVVLTTDSRQPPLYRGPSLRAAAAALRTWQPELGQHDFSAALQTARGLAGASGRTLLITNSRSKAPPDQSTVGVGEPLDNVGFAGATVVREDGHWRWKAWVQNHSATRQTRSWHIVMGEQRSAEQSLDLNPDALVEIGAAWPDAATELAVELAPDRFTTDDRLPLVRPRPRPLTVTVEGEDDAALFFRKLAQNVEGVTVTATPGATLRLARLDWTAVAAESRGGIFWPPADRRSQVSLMTEPVIPDRHSLVDGLNWQGLVGSGPNGYRATTGDVTLLWQDRSPLVLLRPSAPLASTPHRKLLLAFDWDTSNAARLPSLVLLAERFLTQERDAQAAQYSANFDAGAPIALADAIPPGDLRLSFRRASGGPAVVTSVRAAARPELRAPGGVGLFTLSLGDARLVTGSAQFADPRQSDFRSAETFRQEIPREQKAAVERNTRPDPLAAVWLMLMAAMLTISWWPYRMRGTPSARAASGEVRS